jgi:hypothetical protein
MISYLLVFSLLTIVLAYDPLCLTCKFYIPHNTNPELGTCKRFKDFAFNNNKYTLVNKLAVNCRINEELCGKDGNAHQATFLNKQITDQYEELTNRCCGEVNETDEIEQLEREFFDVLQKIKKHNKRQMYKTTKDLYKLFRRSE